MKKRFIILTIVFCGLLSGCSSENIEEKIDDFKVQYLLDGNEKYHEYLSTYDLHKSNIDQNGYYSSDEIPISELDNSFGKIHVSFASNSLLNTSYYYDNEYRNKIDTNNCYLDAGDTIYAKVDVNSLAQSDTYKFTGFSMTVFDDDKPVFDYASSDGYSIDIPNELQYKEISIIPEGRYEKRKLSFSAECESIGGNTMNMSPVWNLSVDGDQVYSTQSNEFEIKANASYRIEVKYDSEKYYVMSTNPEFDINDEKTGTVKFKQYSPKQAIDNYSITLGMKHYFKIDKIQTKGKTVSIIIDGETIPLSSSSYEGYAILGTKVTIEPTNDIESIGETENLIRLTENGYIFAVGDDTKPIDFDPDDYEYDNGKVIFYNNEHKEISTPISLNKNDVIYYIGKPDSGYSFNMGDVENKIIVDANFKYFLKNALQFNEKQKIDLPQPETGGSIVYYLNGNKIKENPAYFAAGVDKLTASFTPSERYKVNNLSDQAECIVTSSNHRIKFKDNDGNEVSIENVFELSSDQKAELTVELDDSVGTEIKFNIYNGTDTPMNKNKSYVSKKVFDSWGNPVGIDDNQLLKNKSIETVSGIKIAVSDWSPLKNEALRIDVKKTNASKKESNEVYYILSGSGTHFISTDSGNSTYYTEIEIEISKVKGSYFVASDYTYENGTVVISYDDTSSKSALKNGEFVDNSRKMQIKLTANDDYQLYKRSSNPFSKSYDSIKDFETNCKYSKMSEEFTDIKSKTKIEAKSK